MQRSQTSVEVGNLPTVSLLLVVRLMMGVRVVAITLKVDPHAFFVSSTFLVMGGQDLTKIACGRKPPQ